MRGRVRYAWAPSAAFIVAPEEQAGLPGERLCGLLVHRFGDDTVETELLQPPGMDRPFIHDIREFTYPPAS